MALAALAVILAAEIMDLLDATIINIGGPSSVREDAQVWAHAQV